MPSTHLRRVALGFLVSVTALAAGAADTEFNPVAHEPRNVDAPAHVGIIFKLRADGVGASIAKLATGSDRTQAIAKRTGLNMNLRRDISGSLLASTVELGDSSPDQVLATLRADPAIEFAVPDRRRFAQAAPNDPLFAGQWYLQSTETSAVKRLSSSSNSSVRCLLATWMACKTRTAALGSTFFSSYASLFRPICLPPARGIKFVNQISTKKPRA